MSNTWNYECNVSIVRNNILERLASIFRGIISPSKTEFFLTIMIDYVFTNE